MPVNKWFRKKTVDDIFHNISDICINVLSCILIWIVTKSATATIDIYYADITKDLTIEYLL